MIGNVALRNKIPYMNVTAQENEAYRQFVSKVTQELGVFDFTPNQIVWHYTNGPGFLGILESSSIHATQVASLNDANETKYATDLYKEVIKELIDEQGSNAEAVAFLTQVLEFVKEEPSSPTHGSSKFFVACFSADENDLNQWRLYGGDNPYAIGFYARGLCREATSQLYKVVYDRAKQLNATKEVARATLRFYLEGLTGDRLENPEEWARIFFEAWDEWVYRLAPLAKDDSWRSENEFRLVHALKLSEFPKVRFRQRTTVLARYLALDTPNWVRSRAGLLPIAKIWIGPGERQAFTKAGVELLLEQMGYASVPVELSKLSLVRP